MNERRYRRAEELEGPQRQAAEAVGNVVVAAGAGSGKTTVLAARYVHLLETGRLDTGERVSCRNILVLTFTRKAAAEMYGRIYGALAESAALAATEPALKREPELAAHLASCLADFSQAQISTFDSFAARIARSGAARFGVAPDFAIDEEGAREEAKALALSFVLEHREEEALRDLVSALGLKGAQEEVFADLAVERMTISTPPDFAAFHAAQGPRLESMAAAVREELLAMRAAVLDYESVKTTETSQKWLKAMAEAPGEDEASFAAFAASLESLRKPGSNSKDEASQFLSSSVDGIKKAAAAYRGIAATKAAHPSRLGLYRLLDDFRAQWDASRRRERMLTFRDVAQLALDTLESDEELRRHYQGLYRYAMIDEFQDDNELQKRILFLIAGGPGGLAPDKLFFVGDEKQSIYLFRGADVSVFRRLAGELGARAIPLSRNFRSEPGVIDIINVIFPSVMAPRDPEKGRADFEASFEELASREATVGVTPRFVYLELPYREARPRDAAECEARPRDAAECEARPRDAAECEAWEVARIVRDAVEEGSLLVADRKTGEARGARYEDFAILLRSTSKQVHFEKYLRLFGVPYGSENACGLFSEAVACDLYYALRLALYPEDRNALAAFLRSPFAGLSDEAIVRLLLASEEPGFEPFGPEAAALVPETERRSHARGAATMAQLGQRIDREPVATSVSYLWYEAGYRAALLRDPVASAFEEHFELVHSMAVSADERGSGLASFVAELELLIGEPDKLEIDLPRESSRGVKIMTIHKSKGLEFPVVILPQTNNTGRDRSAQEAWFWDDDIGPTFKPPAAIGERSRNAFFDGSKERREAMEIAEIKRLLYVGLTRAESQLIVTATEPRNSDAKGRSFRTLLGESLGLFMPPSPGGAAALSLKPFGELTTLGSGALVGLIPERSDLDYYHLVAGARNEGPKAGNTRHDASRREDTRREDTRREDTRREDTRRVDIGLAASVIPVVDRSASPISSTVTAAAARYEQLRPMQGRREDLAIAPEIAPPAGLSAEDWGSLVHAVLEAGAGPKPKPLDPRMLAGALREKLGAVLGEGPAVAKAIERAQALAEIFFVSELGQRALAAKERFVELEVAMSLKCGASAPRIARGVIDLAFIEGRRVVVVDYKTDSVIQPAGHAFQLAAYRRAAEQIFDLPAEAWVFYLYGGGRALPAEARAGEPMLEEAFL